jgi:hypothetical protein
MRAANPPTSLADVALAAVFVAACAGKTLEVSANASMVHTNALIIFLFIFFSYPRERGVKRLQVKNPLY